MMLRRLSAVFVPRAIIAQPLSRRYADAPSNTTNIEVNAGEKKEEQSGRQNQRQVGGLRRQRGRRDDDSFFSDWGLGFPNFSNFPSLTSVFRGPSFLDWFGSDKPLLSEQSTFVNPRVDVYETDKNYAIDVEVPGMKKSELKIRLEDDYLTISGEKRFEKEERDKKHRFRRMERSYGSFQRSFELPVGINESQIEAKYVDGVLKITVPKPVETTQRETARQIEIKDVTPDDINVQPSS
jgi:HSP20 family protein